jgi:hypothetical protein
MEWVTVSASGAKGQTMVLENRAGT